MTRVNTRLNDSNMQVTERTVTIESNCQYGHNLVFWLNCTYPGIFWRSHLDVTTLKWPWIQQFIYINLILLSRVCVVQWHFWRVGGLNLQLFLFTKHPLLLITPSIVLSLPVCERDIVTPDSIQKSMNLMLCCLLALWHRLCATSS